jgi:hypothetical protein
VSKAGHRWPEAQRIDAEARRAGETRGVFHSTATGDFPTFTSPRPVFWTVALTLAVAIAALTRALDKGRIYWTAL